MQKMKIMYHTRISNIQFLKSKLEISDRTSFFKIPKYPQSRILLVLYNIGTD